jgi:hypothetical protein
MSLQAFCEWLASTEGSIRLHESLYMYPTIESIHVWALTLFIGMTVMLDFRLVGLALRRVPVSEVARRLLPWTVAGFAVMVLTGALLFYAIPVRTYHSVFFRAKVVLLILAGINAWVFHAHVWRSVTEWEHDVKTPPSARAAGWLSLALWICIIFAGRMIAYNWFDCDRQPQPDWVNVLAACTEAKQ